MDGYDFRACLENRIASKIYVQKLLDGGAREEEDFFKHKPDANLIPLFFSLPNIMLPFTLFYNQSKFAYDKIGVQGCIFINDAQENCQKYIPVAFKRMWDLARVGPSPTFNLPQSSSYQPSLILKIRRFLDENNFEAIDELFLGIFDEFFNVISSYEVSSFDFVLKEEEITNGIKRRVYERESNVGKIHTFWDLNSEEPAKIEFGYN